MRMFDTLDQLEPLIGQEIGLSDWIEVDQARINAFAEATEDRQWIHTDPARAAAGPFGATIAQIIALDLVFSIDSILTAVGMTDDVPIMVAAVLIAVGMMLLAADPLGRFIGNNPAIVMLALGFLLMIGMVLIADGFGYHVPKGYIYAAMAFSAGVEALNMLGRRSASKKEKAEAARAEAERAEARARKAEAEAAAEGA